MDHSLGLETKIRHYIISSEEFLLQKSDGLTSGLAFCRDVTSSNQQVLASPSQEATGKNTQEVSYQVGSKDKISHTKSSGFHFIETHQGTVGTMLIFMVLGFLLCCLKAARGHLMRRQHFRATENQGKNEAGGRPGSREPAVHLGQGLLNNSKHTQQALESWPDEHTDTTWWSLSDNNLLSGGSAPQPAREYHKTNIEEWKEEALRLELTNRPPLGDSSSKVVYLGEVGPMSRARS